MPPNSRVDPFGVAWRGGARLVDGALYLTWENFTDTGTLIFPAVNWILSGGFVATFDLLHGRHSSGVSFCFGDLGAL